VTYRVLILRRAQKGTRCPPQGHIRGAGRVDPRTRRHATPLRMSQAGREGRVADPRGGLSSDLRDRRCRAIGHGAPCWASEGHLSVTSHELGGFGQHGTWRRARAPGGKGWPGRRAGGAGRGGERGLRSRFPVPGSRLLRMNGATPVPYVGRPCTHDYPFTGGVAAVANTSGARASSPFPSSAQVERARRGGRRWIRLFMRLACRPRART
jgi:hypothetical protein